MTLQWIFNTARHRQLFSNIAGKQKYVKKIKMKQPCRNFFVATVTFNEKYAWRLQWLAERARLYKEEDI